MTAQSNSRNRAASFAALFLFWLAGVLFAGMVTNAAAEMRKEVLKIVTSSGEHSFTTEIAESPADRARGLMFRRSLADDAAMLFPHSPPGEATMWMKNTYISLDMVFIRADGIVHRIETGTEPFSEAVIASNGPVSAVLELRAGIAAKINLKPGDRVLHATFAAPK